MSGPVGCGALNKIRRYVFALFLLTASLGSAAAQTLQMNSGPDFGTFSIGDLQIELDASGGNGTYTWSVISGSLPPGMLVRTDRASFFSNNASAGIIGVATTPGTYAFTLSVSSAGQTVVRACTMKITALHMQDIYQQQDAFVGVFYSHKFTLLNNAGVVSYTAVNGLPPGMNLAADGTLSGTPTQSGFYNILIRMTDGVDTVLVTRALPVFDVQITTDGTLPNTTQDTPYNAAIAASGGTPPYMFTSSGMPGNLVLSPAGVISGSLSVNPGHYLFDVTATDANHLSYTRRMSVDVVGKPPQLPRIAPYGAIQSFDDCVLGDDCADAISVNQGGTAPFTWTAAGLPQGMAIRFGSGVASSYINPGDAEIYGRPSQLGDFNVTVSVTDAMGASSTNTFPLHVSEIFEHYNDRIPNGFFTFGVPGSFKLRAIGGTGSYSFTSLYNQLPNGLAFDFNNFLLSGTPNEAGNFNAVLQFKDSANHSVRISNFLNVGYPSNGQQTINFSDFPDLGSVTADDSYSRQLFACCAPSLIWTLANGTLPPGFSLSATGLLSGSSSTVGVYTFVVQAADAGNSANFGVRYFKLTITPIRNTTQFLLPPGNVGTSYNFTFTATGGTGSLNWSQPAGQYFAPGLSLSGNGTLSGTPTGSGQYQGFVNVTDQAGHVTPIFYDLFIYPAGQNPPLNLPFGPNLGQFVLGRLYLQLQATGGSPPYHYSYKPGANVVPGMRVQDGQPLPTFFSSQTTGGFIGVLTTTGPFSTSIRVTDSVGNVFDRDIHFTVAGVAYAGPFNLVAATANVPYAYALVAAGGSGNYKFTANGQLPPGLTVDPSGLISGTPTTPGLYNAQFVVTDLSTSDRTFFGVNIEVNAFAITTGGILPQGTVGNAFNLQFGAPGCGTGCTWSLFGGLPGNVSMSSSGLLSGTPSFSGNFRFTVQASGSVGIVQQNFSWAVVTSPPQPLSIQMDSEFTSIAFYDTAGYQLTAQGGTPPYSWAVTSGSLPTGTSLQPSGEVFSSGFSPGYTILAGKALAIGIYHFTLQVTDATNNVASQDFTLNVSRLGFEYFNLPIAGNPLVYNTAYSQPLMAVGGDSNYTWTNIDSLPPGLNVSAAGLVSGTPTVTGQYFERMRVVDGAGNYSRNFVGFNIVSGTAATLTFNSGPNLGIFQEGSQPRIFLNPAGGTGPYTINIVSPLPPGFEVLTNANQPASGATANNFVLTGSPMATGPFSFTAQIEDSVGNVGARTFALTIAPFTLLNNTSLADGSVGVPYSVPLLAFDNSGTPVWSQVPNSPLPPGLSLATGSISGTPTQAGQFLFQLDASDGGTTIRYTFTVHISSLTITDAAVLPNGTVGVPYNYSFAAAGTGAITWSATGLPSGLQLSSSGVITGTPQGITRANVFVTEKSATDRVSKRFVLYVTLPNPSELTLPATVLPDAVIDQNFQSGLVPSGGTPPYTFALATGSTLPPGLALYSGAFLRSVQNTRTPAVTILAGVPTTAGQYSFDLMLTDAAGRQARGTFTLNVASFNVLPTFLPTTITGQPVAQQFSVVGGTAPYTFSVTPVDLFTLALPAGIGMSSSGLLSGTLSDTGFFGFVLHVQDASGQTFSRSYFFDITNQKGLEAFGGPLYDTSVGAGLIDGFSTNGNSTYTWSVVSGSLPPGTQVMRDDAVLGPNGWGIMGAPTTVGTYTFTVRAMDNTDATNFADETLTLRVVPFQRVAPLQAEIASRSLPTGTVGQPYSFVFKFAGGKAPYTVAESELDPLPAGLSLSANGTLTGIPQVSGTFIVVPVVTDAQGFTANLIPSRLVITPAGAISPLVSTCCYDFNYYGLSGPFDDASVGVPYHFKLDDYLQGGVPPYSWSVTPGSSLPAGMALLLGTNGVQNHLGGVPTVPGTYNFQLTAKDSSGQTLTLTLSGPVNVLTLSPDYLPPAVIGSSYSAPLVPSGGTAPYSFHLQPYSALPVGMSLSSAGLLSGIPTSPGYFKVYVALTDSTGNTLNKAYQITVDTAAGDSPAVSLGPKPIQVVYTLGSPSPVSVPVNVNTTSGAYAFALAESGLPGATLSVNSGTSPAVVNLSINTTSLGAGSYSGLIGVAAPQTVNQFDTVPVLLAVVPPQPCTFTLNPPSTTVIAGGGTGSFSISTGASCTWAATVSDSSFISISTGCGLGHVCASYNGSGSGTLIYKIAANAGSSPRSGSITVSGTVYNITQFGTGGGCAYAVNPTSLMVAAAGGLVPVTVKTSDPTCQWTASGLSAPPTTFTGNGSVTLTIPANLTASTVVLNATVAGQTFTAAQSGANCAVGLSASDASWPANGGAGAVKVSTPVGCSYSTVTGPSWITVTSGGTGSGTGTLLYSVDPNSTTQPRSGALIIGGTIFQINEQALACSVSLDTSQLGSPFGSGGGSGAIAVTTNGSNCSWSGQVADPWVMIAPGAGTGSGTIGVTIGSNASSSTGRTSSVTINGQSVNISQAGTTCSYALQSANGNVPAAGGSGLVGVIAPSACSWTSSTNDPSWLTISSSGTGGNGDVQFVAQRNTSSTLRSGSLTIAGLTYTVSQDGAPCSYTLGTKSTNVSSSGLNGGTFNFSTTASSCSPNAVSYSNWITASTSFSGTSGSVTFNVAPNFSGMNRQGIIQLGDQSFTVTENAAACAYSLNSYGEVFSHLGGSDQVLGSPNASGCTPLTGTDQPSFITLGPLAGPVNNIFTQPFQVAPFNSAVPDLRFATITFGGQIFAIKQTSW